MRLRRILAFSLALGLGLTFAGELRQFTQIGITLSAVGGSPAGTIKPRKKPKQKKAPPLLDPLRQIKMFKGKKATEEFGPNIIIAIDRSSRMSYDFNNVYYDPIRYDKQASYDNAKDTPTATVATTLGVSATARYYYRMYTNLVKKVKAKNSTYDADRIDVVDDKNAGYDDFFLTSRLGMARDGLAQVISENIGIIRFGIVAMRQGNEAKWPDKPGNEKPVNLKDSTQKDWIGDVKNKNEWKITYGVPDQYNTDANAEGSDVLVKTEEKSSAKALKIMQSNPNDGDGIRPFGDEDPSQKQDSPVANLLTDTKAEVIRVMGKDKDAWGGCRNTAVILVVGGTDGTKGNGPDPVSVAATYQAITVKGATHRVPIYVIAVGPPSEDVSELKAIADASGGKYIEALDANDVALAANEVVQALHGRPGEFNSGKPSEFQSAGQVVATVDLNGAKDINGSSLPNTNLSSGGSVLYQRNNVIFTAGFVLPSFAARMRAFRAYKPVADAASSNGYKFVKDGTPLWVAHPPGGGKKGDTVAGGTPVPGSRNIYTYVPGQGMMAFTTTNAATLKPYLQMSTDAASSVLIDFVRKQPLGAIISSTPAVLTPPGLTNPPDSDYTTFQNARKSRRSLVFYGGNAGMIHAIDGRTGVEAWAFIPFNMLPKLQTLLDGQGVDAFDYFNDASPRIADVKVGGVWRTYLTIGQGAGGTFYSTFDVSDAGNNISTTVDDENSVLTAFADKNVIPFKWSYPNNNSFDYASSSDTMPFGDLKSSATSAEKAVGETWSTPAIGQVGGATGKFVAVVGSGYLDAKIEALPARGSVKAGHTLYVLDMTDGSVVSSYDVGDAKKGNLKNSLTADAVTVGPENSSYIDKVYIGDTEGNMWRFGVNANATLATPVKIYDAEKEYPIFTSAAVVTAGGNQNYVFFSTGIDTLPAIKKMDKFELIGLLDTGGGAKCAKKDKNCEKFTIKLEKSDGKKGDERSSSGPVVAGNTVFWTTTTELLDEPCSPPQSSLYAATFLGGPAYDTNASGTLTTADKVEAATFSGRASAPFLVDNHLYLTAGNSLEVFGDPEGFNAGVGKSSARMLSWREVR